MFLHRKNIRIYICIIKPTKQIVAFKGTADSSDTAFDLMSWFTNDNTENSTAENTSAVLDGIFTIDTTTPKDFTGNSFFENADHVGAVTEAKNWTAGWTVGLEE